MLTDRPMGMAGQPQGDGSSGDGRFAPRAGRLACAWISRLALAVVLIGAAAGAQAAPSKRVTGTVERVIDGDSLLLRVAADRPPLEVRLKGIDAPEGCQPGGREAREMLEGFVTGKEIAAVVSGLDGYGRTLATIEVDGLNVNQRMVAEGHAWSLRTKWDRGPYVGQERLAQSLKRGLHGAGNAELPADFRRRHGPCGRPSASDAPASAPATASAPVAPAAAGGSTTPAVAAGFRCDGRNRCSQMTSCAEATWFLRNCPGVQMDGNRDGVPCERQWCRP